MGNRNRYYDDEFKASVVKMLVEKGRAISSVSRDLGVSQLTKRRWIKNSSETEDSIAKRLLELKAENRKLKKEQQNTNAAVDILKSQLPFS